MIANQSVSRGRDIAPDDLGNPFQACCFDHVLKDGFLDTPAENAAGHDPAVDLQAPAGLAANHGGNHSVIAEDVLEARLDRERIGIRLQGGDSGFVVAADRQVELA
jgi:hypothetical protein